MKTRKGNTYTTLLNVRVDEGVLSLNLHVPMTIGHVDADFIERIVPAINDRISREVKPGATYERCLEQIDLHRDHLAKAYTELFETYQRTLMTATRTSPVDKAKYEMLSSIPDNKLLKQMCALTLGDKVDDYILPDDRESLITDTVAAMRNKG